MRIHHLNCGTLHPPGASMVSHVLLIEAPDHLVLVDAGFGLADFSGPGARIGPYRHLVRPVLRQQETALRQVRERGFDPRDVRHIVLTHADFDHAGGIADFPWARVHLSELEARAVRSRPSWLERRRYRPSQWDHRPMIVEHPWGTEHWEGFDGVAALDAVAPGMLLVPLPGHTAGHVGVAVLGADGWVLHAGDAFHDAESLAAGRSEPLVRLRQALLAHDRDLLRSTQRRLAALAARRGADLRIVNAHDRELFEVARAEH